MHTSSDEVGSTHQPVAQVYGSALEFAQIGLLAQTPSPYHVHYDVCDFSLSRHLGKTA